MKIFNLTLLFLTCSLWSQNLHSFYFENDSVKILDYHVQFFLDENNFYANPNENGDIDIPIDYIKYDSIIFNDGFNSLNIKSLIKKNKRISLPILNNTLNIGEVSLSLNPTKKIIGPNYKTTSSTYFAARYLVVNGIRITEEMQYKKIKFLNIQFKNKEGLLNSLKKINLVIFQLDSIIQDKEQVLLEKEFSIPLIKQGKQWVSFDLSQENIYIEDYNYLYFGFDAPSGIIVRVKNKPSNSFHSCTMLKQNLEQTLSDKDDTYIWNWYCKNYKYLNMNIELTN